MAISHFRLLAPHSLLLKALLMHRKENPELCPSWRFTHVLFKVGSGVLSGKDVKNEDRSGDVHENKRKTTKCTPLNSAFCKKMHRLRDNGRQSSWLFWRKCTVFTIIRREVTPFHETCPAPIRFTQGKLRAGSKNVGGGTGSLP